MAVMVLFAKDWPAGKHQIKGLGEISVWSVPLRRKSLPPSFQSFDPMDVRTIERGAVGIGDVDGKPVLVERFAYGCYRLELVSLVRSAWPTVRFGEHLIPSVQRAAHHKLICIAEGELVALVAAITEDGR